MSEAEGTVRIKYEVDGAEESARSTDALKESVEGVGEEARRTGGSMGGLAASMDTAKESTDSLTASAVESGFKAAELRERIGQATAAMGSMASMLGTESDAGALLGRMSQWSSLGTQVGGVFGPAGAVVGGITGALIPALDELTGGFDGVTESAERAMRAAETASTRILAAARASRAEATTEAASREDLALAASRSLLDRQRATDAAIDVRRADLEATALAIAASATRGDEARQQNAQMRLRFVRGQLNEINIEIEEREQQRRTTASRETTPDPVAAPTATRTPRTGGRARPEFDREVWLSEQRSIIADEQEAREVLELQRIDAVARAEQEALSTLKAQQDSAYGREQEEALKRIEERADAEMEALAAQDAKRLQQKRAADAESAKWKASSEAMLDATLGGATAIGGAFATAFGAAIQGQEDFGTAALKGMKEILIQYGIGQVAEGVGALFSAVGLLFTNPPGAAGKAVEGAGKIALGVGLGAAGAAISVPSAGGSADAAPRLGPDAPQGGTAGGVTVNLNSPAVIAGTRAQLGRDLGRTITDSRRRFGAAA